MKKHLLRVFTALICHVQLAFAWPGGMPYNQSTFEIKSHGAGYISVAFDHHLYPNQTKLFSISNVAPGNHYLEIFTERIVYHGYYATNERVKIYSGNVYIEPASIMKGAVDQNGRFFIKDVDPLVVQYPDYPYQPYDPYNQYPMYNQFYPMNDGDFRALVDVIEDQWYDDTRLSVAIQALSMNYFTSQQVATIMSEFWYEDTKLEFAKAAYACVTDPANYFIINKQFWYSSSVEELNQYLASR